MAAATFTAVTQEQCAQRCDEHGIGCAAYEYCERFDQSQRRYVNTCRMSADGRHVADSVSTNDVDCGLYSKLSTTQLSQSGEIVWKKKFANVAASVCVSLLFVALGVALGAILYQKKIVRVPAALSPNVSNDDL